MPKEASQEEIPFQVLDWVVDRHNPGQPGQYTGNWRQAGTHLMVQLRFPSGGTAYRPLSALDKMPQAVGGDSLAERLASGHFGKARDLQRLITHEKLRGTLHEVIYSMEAAKIDFYPYQFKPVIKFIDSPTERLIIADEVGLGKTIESALIWMELQARRQAKRLLVVCPKILTEKWRDELRTKFLIDARVVDFRDLQQEVAEALANGPSHSFALIGSYTGLRPPKADLGLLKEPPDQDEKGSAKTRFLRELRHWSLGYDPFDLVIFDEAHYMRNPATTLFHLGESLSYNAGAVLCVSATPVHNSNVDLHSLLRLIDESFFETQGVFEELLDANRPAVQAGNALARTPIDEEMLESAVEGMSRSRFISNAPLFKQFLGLLEKLDPKNKAQVAKCQDLIEKLNLLGGYINRTRRVQVKENRPLRDPLVLPVEYSKPHMRLYKAILEIVRRKCRRDKRPFHVFQVLGLQLRAASCLPAMAAEIRSGRFGDPEALFDEAIGEELLEELADDSQLEDQSEDFSDISELLEHDFESDDRKYEELKRMLTEIIPDEKVVVFAYYRATLAYLGRRLTEDNINLTTIHGGVDNEQRWKELERFKDPRGPRVLLSSEVGSEGIDLQFCRVITNYDLPWNPMRVEQRIGRIDRVGQQAKRLSIVNFKIKDTVEERLYERLHSKLERFANSLGDLESIIGKEVQNLTVELLSKELSPEQEARLMDQSEQVIEQRLLQIQALKESGDALVALSDYVQKRIAEDREMGRYIQPEELDDYLTDFFEREFQGTELNHNTPVEGCLRVRLNLAAQASLTDFVRDDRSLTARPLRQREFGLTFRRDVFQRLNGNQRRLVSFANHLSPLVRWVTKVNEDRFRSFYDVSALIVTHPTLPPGDYCYRIERWQMRGLSTKETLAYGVAALSDGSILPAHESEAAIQNLLRQARDWDYVDCNLEMLANVHATLEQELSRRFGDAVEEFQDESDTTHQIKLQRVRNIFERRIAQDEQRLRTLREAHRDPRIIRLTEGRLRAAAANKIQRLSELDEKAKTDVGQKEVAAGVFRIVNEDPHG